MALLVGYGSFVNRASFERTLKWREPKLIWVEGFRRVFNLVPSRLNLYKNLKPTERTVLNVTKDEDKEFNALLFEIEYDELEILKMREKSYNLRKVKILDFITKKPLGEAMMFYGKNKLYGEEIIDNTFLPIPEYLEKCLNGAAAYGDKFYEAWLDTTFTGNNISIRKFINKT